MVKKRPPAERDVEAESERRPPPRLDPEELKRRIDHWRGEIGRVGRGDQHGGVYRVGNFDHDGKELTASELARLNERDGVNDEPVDWEEELGRVGRGDARPSGVFRLPGYDHDGNPISAVEEARLDERDEELLKRRGTSEHDLPDD